MIMAAADIPIPKQMVETSGLHVLHGVVDRHPRIAEPPGRVDVERDVPLRIVGLEEEELRHDQVRDLVVDLPSEEDDAVARRRE